MDFRYKDEEVYDLLRFKNDWVDVLKKDDSFWEDKTFGLYIANPFCISKCNFCIYNPTVTKIGSDIYTKYYKDFLPSVISFFNDLFDIRVPKSIYFGGGTVNVMSPEILKDICFSINRFSEIKYKHIECNPLLLTEHMMETIVELGFDFVSLGVQTFNEEILLKESRKNPFLTKLKDIVGYFQEHKIIVNCDLLAFLKTGELRDLEVLKNDLELLKEEVLPDVINIYPMYQRFNGRTDSVLRLTKNMQRFKGLRKTVIEFLNDEKYQAVSDVYYDMSEESLFGFGIANYKLVKASSFVKYSEVYSYNSSGYEYRLEEDFNLGLGGYGDNIPYSYFGINNFYYMYNLDNEDVIITKRGNFKPN